MLASLAARPMVPASIRKTSTQGLSPLVYGVVRPIALCQALCEQRTGKKTDALKNNLLPNKLLLQQAPARPADAQLPTSRSSLVCSSARCGRNRLRAYTLRTRRILTAALNFKIEPTTSADARRDHVPAPRRRKPNRRYGARYRVRLPRAAFDSQRDRRT